MTDCPECAALPADLAAIVGWRHFHTPAACWELLRLVAQRHLGIVLPFENVLEQRRRWRELVAAGQGRFGGVLWRRAAAPARAYDGVLFRFEATDHMGIALDGRRFLHVPRPEVGACLGEIARWAERAESWGIYRLAGR